MRNRKGQVKTTGFRTTKEWWKNIGIITIKGKKYQHWVNFTPEDEEVIEEPSNMPKMATFSPSKGLWDE